MLPAVQLSSVLGSVRLTSVHGPWSRAMALRHLMRGARGALETFQPLWGGAARLRGGRFTPRDSFDCIYLAWDPVTALAEVQAMAFLTGGTFAPRTPPWVLMSVDGIVGGVLDLTDAGTLTALSTHPQEIMGPWELSADPPTQSLARAAFDTARIAGIRYPSARHLGKGLNLVVFSDRLLASSANWLEVHDLRGNLNQRIGT